MVAGVLALSDGKTVKGMQGIVVVTSVRLLAAIVLAASFSAPAAARDTWRYLSDKEAEIFGMHEPAVTLILTCESDKVGFGLTLQGSESEPLIDEERAPGEVRVPLSLMVAVDGSPAEEYVGHTLYLSHTGTMSNFNGKDIAYRLAEHLGAAASGVELAVVFEGNQLWRRALAADGAIAASRQWISKCGERYTGS